MIQVQTLDTSNDGCHLVLSRSKRYAEQIIFHFSVHFYLLCFLTDFECILDKNKKPLSYTAQNILLDDLRGIHLRHDIKDEERKALPQGAQRLVHKLLTLFRL